jgi:hypothetical protein
MKGTKMRAPITFVVASLALAACAPRLENRAGELVTRTYAQPYQRLADCAFRRLDNEWERARKVDLPSEKKVTLSFAYEGGGDIWKAEFVSTGADSTRVQIPYPMTFAETHPDRIFRQIDICAGLVDPPSDPAMDKPGLR